MGDVVPLQRCNRGATARPGRYEITTAGNDPNVQLVGGDPWGSPAYTGLWVPTTPTTSLNGPPWYQSRYLFMAARASFQVGERVRLVGLRQYASLVGIPSDEIPTPVEEFPIGSPLWRFPDGNISWHVQLVPHGHRDTRNPANAPSLLYRDAGSPSLLYESLGPYVPPNAGRPWGKPISSDLGNIHDLRYPWRDSQVELELDIPIVPPIDVVVFVSVAQHDTSITASLSSDTLASATPETRFWATWTNVQYGRIAASLIFRREE